MSLIYLKESEIEVSFVTAFYALDFFNNNNPIHDLSEVNYFPLKISFFLFNFQTNQQYTQGVSYPEILFNNHSSLNDLSLDEGAIAYIDKSIIL